MNYFTGAKGNYVTQQRQQQQQHLLSRATNIKSLDAAVTTATTIPNADKNIGLTQLVAQYAQNNKDKTWLFSKETNAADAETPKLSAFAPDVTNMTKNKPTPGNTEEKATVILMGALKSIFGDYYGKEQGKKNLRKVKTFMKKLTTEQTNRDSIVKLEDIGLTSDGTGSRDAWILQLINPNNWNIVDISDSGSYVGTMYSKDEKRVLLSLRGSEKDKAQLNIHDHVKRLAKNDIRNRETIMKAVSHYEQCQFELTQAQRQFDYHDKKPVTFHNYIRRATVDRHVREASDNYDLAYKSLLYSLIQIYHPKLNSLKEAQTRTNIETYLRLNIRDGPFSTPNPDAEKKYASFLKKQYGVKEGNKDTPNLTSTAQNTAQTETKEPKLTPEAVVKFMEEWQVTFDHVSENITQMSLMSAIEHTWEDYCESILKEYKEQNRKKKNHHNGDNSEHILSHNTTSVSATEKDYALVKWNDLSHTEKWVFAMACLQLMIYPDIENLLTRQQQTSEKDDNTAVYDYEKKVTREPRSPNTEMDKNYNVHLNRSQEEQDDIISPKFGQKAPSSTETRFLSDNTTSFLTEALKNRIRHQLINAVNASDAMRGLQIKPIDFMATLSSSSSKKTGAPHFPAGKPTSQPSVTNTLSSLSPEEVAAVTSSVKEIIKDVDDVGLRKSLEESLPVSSEVDLSESNFTNLSNTLNALKGAQRPTEFKDAEAALCVTLLQHDRLKRTLYETLGWDDSEKMAHLMPYYQATSEDKRNERWKTSLEALITALNEGFTKPTKTTEEKKEEEKYGKSKPITIDDLNKNAKQNSDSKDPTEDYNVAEVITKSKDGSSSKAHQKPYPELVRPLMVSVKRDWLRYREENYKNTLSEHEKRFNEAVTLLTAIRVSLLPPMGLTPEQITSYYKSAETFGYKVSQSQAIAAMKIPANNALIALVLDQAVEKCVLATQDEKRTYIEKRWLGSIETYVTGQKSLLSPAIMTQCAGFFDSAPSWCSSAFMTILGAFGVCLFLWYLENYLVGAVVVGGSDFIRAVPTVPSKIVDFLKSFTTPIITPESPSPQANDIPGTMNGTTFDFQYHTLKNVSFVSAGDMITIEGLPELIRGGNLTVDNVANVSALLRDGLELCKSVSAANVDDNTAEVYENLFIQTHFSNTVTDKATRSLNTLGSPDGTLEDLSGMLHLIRAHVSRSSSDNNSSEPVLPKDNPYFECNKDYIKADKTTAFNTCMRQRYQDLNSPGEEHMGYRLWGTVVEAFADFAKFKRKNNNKSGNDLQDIPGELHEAMLPGLTGARLEGRSGGLNCLVNLFASVMKWKSDLGVHSSVREFLHDYLVKFVAGRFVKFCPDFLDIIPGKQNTVDYFKATWETFASVIPKGMYLVAQSQFVSQVAVVNFVLASLWATLAYQENLNLMTLLSPILTEPTTAIGLFLAGYSIKTLYDDVNLKLARSSHVPLQAGIRFNLMWSLFTPSDWMPLLNAVVSAEHLTHHVIYSAVFLSHSLTTCNKAIHKASLGDLYNAGNELTKSDHDYTMSIYTYSMIFIFIESAMTAYMGNLERKKNAVNAIPGTRTEEEQALYDLPVYAKTPSATLIDIFGTNNIDLDTMKALNKDGNTEKLEKLRKDALVKLDRHTTNTKLVFQLIKMVGWWVTWSSGLQYISEIRNNFDLDMSSDNFGNFLPLTDVDKAFWTPKMVSDVDFNPISIIRNNVSFVWNNAAFLVNQNSGLESVASKAITMTTYFYLAWQLLSTESLKSVKRETVKLYEHVSRLRATESYESQVIKQSDLRQARSNTFKRLK